MLMRKMSVNLVINLDVKHVYLLLIVRIVLMGIHIMRRNVHLARLRIVEFVRRVCAPSVKKIII